MRANCHPQTIHPPGIQTSFLVKIAGLTWKIKKEIKNYFKSLHHHQVNAN